VKHRVAHTQRGVCRRKEGDDRNRTGVDGFAARRILVIRVISRRFQFCEVF
jgi:hypothetical protein